MFQCFVLEIRFQNLTIKSILSVQSFFRRSCEKKTNCCWRCMIQLCPTSILMIRWSFNFGLKLPNFITLKTKVYHAQSIILLQSLSVDRRRYGFLRTILEHSSKPLEFYLLSEIWLNIKCIPPPTNMVHVLPWNSLTEKISHDCGDLTTLLI